MLKKLFIALILVFAAPVFAGSFMNHEKFVHLTYEEQKKIVISMMEVMVEMEQQYHKETKTSGFDQNRFERYTDMMRKFSNLLFPEAHAARNVRYGQYINELRRLVTTRNGNKCLYGGWISEMVGNKCTHPNFSASRSLYQTESGCNDGRNEITCNPAIFGFKNVTSKTLFCVPAGEAGADNSSRDCMVKALKNPPEAGASSPDVRIRNMIEGIAANPLDSNAVFDFLLQACACDAQKVSPQMNQRYAEYMRPHQTCLGILRMMSEIDQRCPATAQPFDQNQLSFLQKIKTLLNENEINDNANVTASYRNALSRLRTDNPEFRSSEAAVCGTTPGAVNVGGDAQCPEDRRRNNNLACCEPDRIANPAKLECIARPAAECPANRRGPNNLCCEENATFNTATNACAVTEVPGITVTNNPPPCGPGETGQPGACVPATRTDTTVTDTVPPTVTTPGPLPGTTTTTTTCTAPEVEIPVADRTPNGPTCQCPGGAAKVAGVCPATPAAACTAPEVEIPVADRTPNGPTCQCPGGAAKVAGACPASTGITIDVKAENKPDRTNTTISVTVAPTTYVVAEYDIIWFRRGFPGAAPARTPRPSVTTTLVGDQPDPDAPASTGTTPVVLTTDQERERSETPGTNETRITGKDGPGSFDVERNPTADYSVCARMIKKSDGKKVAEDCAKVEKKPAAAAPTSSGGGGFMPQQMLGPTRGGSSNAIFNGIR